MDIKLEIKNDPEFKIWGTMMENEDEDISKLYIKTEMDMTYFSVEENKDSNLLSTSVKKEPDDVDVDESDDIKKFKEKFSSSEEDEETLPEIKPEELVLKSECEEEELKAGVHTEGKKDEFPVSFQDTEKHINYRGQEKSLIKKYSCCQCDNKTNSKSCKINHMHKQDNDLKKYVCDYCEYKTYIKSCLKSHLLVKHNTNIIKKYNCDFCDYNTNQIDKLQTHILLLKHKKQFKNKQRNEQICPHCSFKTVKKSNLKRHVLARHGVDAIKKYVCNNCDYKTNRPDIFKNHVLAKHEKNAINRHKCSQCDYRTHRRADLTTHHNYKHVLVKK